jgi:UDPglucose--hexose-1-phosphate uridylyltransferase
MIHQLIEELISFSTYKELITVEDQIYVYNQLCALFKLEGQNPSFKEVSTNQNVDTYLKPILDYAVEKKLIALDTVVNRDIFEDQIMNHFMPRPGDLTKQFYQKLFENPVEATDFIYHIAQQSNYIKTSRINKNIQYKEKNTYGYVEIAINLSKPEKDPRDILKASKERHNYPSCLLCKEHVGHIGSSALPPRMTHRIIPLSLNNERFYLQYSPYSHYNEHCIVLSDQHVPMNVGRHTFQRLLDFVDQLPHYFLGSNAGLPIVGGSILSHEHYQGGRTRFPIEDAKIIKSYTVNDITYDCLYWPLSTIRLHSKDKNKLINAAEHVRWCWKNYENKSINIYKETTALHNAVTPVARKKDDIFYIDITLRNNLTTKEHPMGLFHPHEKHHHIKKENIGLFEVMGLAILPGRLIDELSIIKEALLKNQSLPKDNIHFEWVESLKETYTSQDVDQFLQQEVAKKFTKLLEDSGVFKQTKEGQEAFLNFIEETIYAY